MSAPGIVRAVYVCAECGEEAAVVELVPRGAKHPDFEADDFLSAPGTLVSRDVIGEQMTAAEEADLEPIAERLAAAGRADTPLSGAEHSRSFCPECRACYCQEHWQFEPVFEDGGWYDCTYGTCPHGHRTMLDD